MGTDFLPIEDERRITNRLSISYHRKYYPSLNLHQYRGFWSRIDDLGIVFDLKNIKLRESQDSLQCRRRTAFVKPEELDNFEIITTPIKDYAYKTTKYGEVYYSPRYQDDKYIYRYVLLSRRVKKEAYRLSKMQPSSLLTDEQIVRHLGIDLSPGWEHFMIYRNKLDELILRRPRNK